MANARQTSGISPAKLGLIIVLSVVLLVMIVVQFGGRWAHNATAKHKQRAEEVTEDAVAVADNRQPVESTPDNEPSDWPTFRISQVMGHNPFALPEALRPAADPDQQAGQIEAVVTSLLDPFQTKMRRRRDEFVASLQEQGVDMILMTPQGRVARVGELTLRVGDVVEGLRVQEINRNGVVFVEQPLTTQP